MHIEELEELMAMHPEVESGCKELSKSNRKHLLLSGLHASARSMLLAAIQRKIGQSVLVVMDNADEAQYMYSDLNTINLPDEAGAKVLFFPVSKRRRQGVDEALAIQRTETLSQLTISIQSGKETAQYTMVVTYPEAIMERVPAPKALEDNTLYLKAGEEIQQSRLTEKLGELGFERVDFVYEPGQYAVRGGIVDVYSYSHDDPFRLDFFGDEIDSIRKFDIETQLSKDKVKQIDIVGVTSGKEQGKDYTIADYIGEDTIWASNDFSLLFYKLGGQTGSAELKENDLAEMLKQRLAETTTIELSEKSYFGTYSHIAFDTLPQPVFNKNFDLLTDDLRGKIAEGYKLYILADQKKQTDRLAAIFEDIAGEPIRFVAVDKTLHAGFVTRV